MSSLSSSVENLKENNDRKKLKSSDSESEPESESIESSKMNKSKKSKINKKELKQLEKKLNQMFFWKSLDKDWQDKLLSNKFLIKDCVGDGNCQFRSIETALTNGGFQTSHKNLRNLIARYINNIPMEEFSTILRSYQLEQQFGEFRGKWDPSSINTKRDFIKEIKKQGFNFEGDNITLSLLSKACKIDFIIFDDTYNIIDISNPDELNSKIIILYYLKHDGHYNTIGYRKKEKIITLFKRKNLPKELELLMNKPKYVIEHIKKIYLQGNSKSKITLNTMLFELEKNTKIKFSKQDKKEIIKILIKWLNDEKFFK
jgi:hypothetical protein